MARSGSEISEDVQLEHKHSYSYVYPYPADVSFRNGEYPYMLCACGDKHPIIDDRRWSVIDKEWAFDVLTELD